MNENSIGRDAPGRTDLPSLPEPVNAAHLVEMAMRSVGNSGCVVELALAWTVTSRPYISGTRGLARWSGMGDQAVRQAVAQDRQVSRHGLIWTRTRGTSSATVEEREDMELRFQSNTRTGHRSYPSNYPPLVDQEALGDLALMEGRKELLRGNAVTSARISERAQEVLVNGMKTLSRLTELGCLREPGQILTMLDPGLDLWAEINGAKPQHVAVEPLGRRAWHLAVLSGLEDVTLSVSDIEGLLGLSKRGAQDLLARMTKANPLTVSKVREGRTFVYKINWASNFRWSGDFWDNAYDRANLRKARAARDKAVQETSARRGTPAGWIAFRLSTASPKRDEYLAENPIPEDADGAWRALVEAGDELALYEYLRAQEAEAGPVPSTPAVLVESAREGTSRSPLQRWPAQDSPASAAVSPELLAEMRKRVVAGLYA